MIDHCLLLNDLKVAARSLAKRLVQRDESNLEAWLGEQVLRIFAFAIALIPVSLFLLFWGARTLPAILLLLVQLCGVVGLAVTLVESVVTFIALWRGDMPMLRRRALICSREADTLQARYLGHDWEPLQLLLRHERERITMRLSFLMTLLGLFLAFYLAGSKRGPMELVSDAFVGNLTSLSWWSNFGTLLAGGMMLASAGAYMKSRRISLMLEILEYMALPRRSVA